MGNSIKFILIFVFLFYFVTGFRFNFSKMFREFSQQKGTAKLILNAAQYGWAIFFTLDRLKPF